MSTGLEQYGQRRGQRYDSSATSVYGLGGGIGHEPPLAHRVHQLPHVLPHARADVARRQHRRDLLERPPVAQFEDLRRRLVQTDRALRNQEHVLAAHVVVLEAGAVHEARAPHAAASGCVAPCSIASSCAQSTSVLNLSAATARSCCSRVTQRSTTSPSAYSASRGACTSRSRKYSRPARSIHGYWASSAASRTRIAPGPK